ncbi:MAG: PrgI family protein [bacterium]|nr:PrgI family protein [bacterium]
MEQHPIPRQITSFEFKLIGFMTLKQFIYLVIFIPLGLIVYFLFPIPLVNILLGVIVGAMGAAFAFVPINERPLDVWVKNLYKRLTSPTQYIYRKHNLALNFINNLYFVTDPHKVMAHIESQEKLAAYLAKAKTNMPQSNRKQAIQTLLRKPTAELNPKKPVAVATPQVSPPVPVSSPSVPVVIPPSTPPSFTGGQPHPFFIGVVKNNKQIPLPGIMIYVKDEKEAVVRLLKTNPHGVFATYNPISPGEYAFEVKDPKGGYFFDTMKYNVLPENPTEIEIYSKELL